MTEIENRMIAAYLQFILSSLLDSFKITVRSYGDDQFIFHHFVYFKMERSAVRGGAAFFFQTAQIFPDGGLWVVAFSPWAVWNASSGMSSMTVSNTTQ